MPTKEGWTLINKKTGKLVRDRASNYFFYEKRRDAEEHRELYEKVVPATLIWEENNEYIKRKSN